MDNVSEIQKGLQQRYEEYLQSIAHADESESLYREVMAWDIKPTVYLELAKLELELRSVADIPVDPGNLEASMRYIQSGKDCSDFSLPAFLRIMYRYQGTKMISSEIFTEIKKTILRYKYWIDEPGEREYTCNYFTENHQILQHCCELLAGQLYPEELFQNGMTGREHAEHAEFFIIRWLDWRARFGFSEWLSNCYYEEDLLALVCLAEFSSNETIAKRSGMVADLILFDIAVNSFEGDFACTHGRSYDKMIIDPARTNTTTITALLWGVGNRKRMNMAAVMMAASGYQVSEVLAGIAHDTPERMENRQRNSIDVEDGEKYGASPADLDNIMLYWGIQQYDHRKVIDNSVRTIAPWDGIGDRIYAFKEKYEQCDRAHLLVEDDPDFTSLTQVDIYTYRTHNYMLSCAQNYRQGKQGYQQHIWEATLGGRAVVFTTHPGSLEYQDRPNYWAGNGIMPKAVAFRNILVCIYRLEPSWTKLWQSHVYFPQNEFDEVITKGNWIFGRKNRGYIAVYCRNGGKWNVPDPSLYRQVYRFDPDYDYSRLKPYDFSSRGHANVWICEMGEEKTHGSFEKFVSDVSAAELAGDSHHIAYHSPSQGLVETGWDEELRINGVQIPVNGYLRYDNPYCRAEFNQYEFDIGLGSKRLLLDFTRSERKEII
jgi:hypothetical protein